MIDDGVPGAFPRRVGQDLEGLPGAGGYREHDILVVTQEGAENITKFPFGPAHNIIAA